MQNQAHNYMTGKKHVIIVTESDPVTVLTGQIQCFKHNVNSK